MFVEQSGAKLVIVDTDPDTFQIDFEKLNVALKYRKQKAIILNSPNNPSGVIFPEAAILKLTQLLSEKGVRTWLSDRR